jgi:hypothetical protein
MGASTLTALPHYHKAKYGKFGAGSSYLKVDRIYAGDLGYVAAGAPAANGVSDKWQGVQMIPIASNDEIHFPWAAPHDLDYRYPIYVRWGLYATAASKEATMTTTYDYVSSGDTAADGATALAETIPGKTPGDDKVDWTYWGETTPATSDFDVLFLKAVATVTTADNVKVWALEIAYTSRTV